MAEFLNKTSNTILILLIATAPLSAQMSMKKLDSIAAFSFSIMSDNKGYSIENESMYKCDKWIREAGDKFILGLGDHVKDNRANPFLLFIKTDSLWHYHFYPNIADGENEFWGEDQADWGAGSPILDYVDLSDRENVKIRNNKCEYYAVEEHEGIKVHIIQLHYSDTPKNPKIAFNKSSRDYLFKTLDNIDKTDKDIIVVLAHTDEWIDVLDKKEREKLLAKADLILDANTHSYKKYKVKNAPENAAAVFNTGAVGNSGNNGFMQIHVLKNPLRMIIQYQETQNATRKLQKKGFAYEKIINGKTQKIDWDNFK
jgi:hypothetical protein